MARSSFVIPSNWYKVVFRLPGFSTSNGDVALKRCRNNDWINVIYAYSARRRCPSKFHEGCTGPACPGDASRSATDNCAYRPTLRPESLGCFLFSVANPCSQRQSRGRVRYPCPPDGGRHEQHRACPARTKAGHGAELRGCQFDGIGCLG